MKFKKIIISFVLIAAAVMQCMPAIALAEQTDAVSINQEEGKARAKKLRRLGAVYDLNDGETEDLTKEVSRGEFAKILVKFLQKKDSYTNVSKKPYTDVELTYEYVRDIKLLKDLGCITDTDKLEYRPEDAVTLDEAAVMILRGLGYVIQSNAQTINIAKSLKLYSGINKNRASGAILDDIYRMLENSLDAALMEEVISADVKYEISDSETILTKYYNITKIRGIVTANQYTGLTDADRSIGEGNIEIDSVKYKLRYKEYADYLGDAVECYVYENKDEDTFEVVWAEQHKNNELLEIEADLLIPERTTDSVIAYYTGDKQRQKNAKLDKNADVIYNGKAYSGYGQIKNTLPETGGIVLIDNDSDGKAEVIKITEYVYYQVANVDSADQVIYESVSNDKIDLSTDENIVEIRNTSGRLVNLAGIKIDSVISVAESKNETEKMIKVIVSETQVPGTVTGIDDDAVLIDGVEYGISKALRTSLAVGNTGWFYIAHDGNAAFFKSESTGAFLIGVVRRVYRDEIEDDVYLSLFTPEGIFVDYPVKEKVRFNATAENPDGNGGKEYAYANLSNGDVIRYSLNDNGEIAKIQTADGGFVTDSGRRYMDKSGLRILSEGTSFFCRNKIFNGTFAMDSNTVFFLVPLDSEWRDAEQFYTSCDGFIYSDQYEYSYEYKAYLFDECDTSVADIILVKGKLEDVSISNESPLYIVDKMKEVYDEDEGDVRTQLTLYGNGSKQVYYCDNETVEKYGVQKGDIIQIGEDSHKKIKKIITIMNADGSSSDGAALVPGVKNDNGDYRWSGRLVYGTVRKKGTSYIDFDVSTTGEGTNYIGLMSQCKLAIREKDDNSVSVASYEELVIGDRFVALVSSGIVRDMIILR